MEEKILKCDREVWPGAAEGPTGPIMPGAFAIDVLACVPGAPPYKPWLGADPAEPNPRPPRLNPLLLKRLLLAAPCSCMKGVVCTDCGMEGVKKASDKLGPAAHATGEADWNIELPQSVAPGLWRLEGLCA